MSIDRKQLVCALIYAALGMGLGIQMAITGNHGQFVTHAHVMLVGFVASLLYAIVNRLWLAGVNTPLAQAQFYVHQFGGALMVVGLYLLYAGRFGEKQLAPALAVGSFGVLLGVLLMLVLVLKNNVRSPLTGQSLTA